MSRLAVCASFLALNITLAHAGELAALLDDVRAATFADDGSWVAAVTTKVGHLELTVDGAFAVPLRTPSGVLVGWLLHGDGTFRYAVDDLADVEAFRASARRLARPLAPDGRLTSPFRSALLLFTSPAFDEISAAVAAGKGPRVLPDGAKAAAKDLGGRVFSEQIPFDHLYAEARLNGRGRFVSAIFAYDQKLLQWELDALRSYREHVYRFRDYSWLGATSTETVSSQRLDRAPEPPPAWLLLERAAIDVRTSDNRSGTIDTELTFRSRLGAATRVVPLALLNNRDPDSFAWNSDKRKLAVTRVSGGGQVAAFSHRYHELLVEVPEGAADGERIVLKFETGGDVFTDMTGRHGDNYFELFGGAWYPRPWGWNSHLARFHVKVRTKKPWRPITSGSEIALREDGDAYELEASSDTPSEWIAVFAGKYVTREETHGKVRIRIHGYAMARKDVLEKLPKLAGAFIAFYESQLGAFPYDELDIVEVPMYGFGVAPSGMVLITTEAWNAQQDTATKYYSRGINSRLAHEIAHQWFAHVAKPASPEENWLSESFAEYWSGLAMAASGVKEGTIQGFPSMVAEWKGNAGYCRDVASLWSANHLGGEDGAYDRWCLLYNRGPLVLHTLRTMVGNDRFSAINRKFLERAAHGFTTTQALNRVANEIATVDLNWFFDDWVRRGGSPDVAVERQVQPLEDGGFLLKGAIRQAPGDAFRRVLVPLVIEYPGGKRDVRLVLQDQPAKPFEFRLDAKPKSIEVDPGKNNLVSYK